MTYNTSLRKATGRIFVYVLGTCILSGQAIAEPRGPEHFEKKRGGGTPSGIEGEVRERPSADDSCQLDAGEVAQFANGEAFHYGSVVPLLSSPPCIAAARSVGQAAMTYGVTFFNKSPLRLDGFAAALQKNDLESSRYMEQSLARTVPAILRSGVYGSNELLKLVGQLAILSPDAARSALTEVITQEIYAGERRLSEEKGRSSDLIAVELSRTLMKVGAGESLIATRLAERVEEMAMLAQSDSIVRLFRGLSAAASVEPGLVPTLNVSAGALNRGILRSNKIFDESARREMLKALFYAAESMLKKGDTLEAGAGELNRAMAALVSGEKLTDTSLRMIWRLVVKTLAKSRSQDALADAMAASLTPKIVFLKPGDIEPILAAARNYPQLAGSVQANFLIAWDREWKALQDGRITTGTFNKNREKYFEPLVVEILNFEPGWVDPFWLKRAIAMNLVDDELVEKRFPRIVLSFLDRRERASRTAAVEPGPEPVVASMAESLAVTWSLNRVHVPALSQWVKKYEN